MQALLHAVLEQCEKFSLRLGSAGRFAQFMPWLAPVLNLPWAISVDFNKAQSAGKMGQALIVLDMAVKLYYDKKVRQCWLVTYATAAMQSPLCYVR
jgi:hypothetical protein